MDIETIDIRFLGLCISVYLMMKGARLERNPNEGSRRIFPKNHWRDGWDRMGRGKDEDRLDYLLRR